ncbi:CHRD domain-containing protein (plasmid) [Pedobacter sp. BS3]|uniref:CHRD domain-containing protein n=1 Tax=Pedobacter sp. BS3 TaxID=2567937 RepID=UPI0011EF199D|nr:CHRD domain-containing protein [Pedobacter sp. BS3]TZF85917.1 CHRD domain-containing protein [Pedobacter sp. BS3]
MTSCLKEELSTRDARLKAPVRSYSVTARIDNKEANNDSEAKGMLKGAYDESTMVFTYTLSFEGVTPRAILFKRGARGSAGTLLWKVPENDGGKYKSPVKGSTVLSALQERDLLKGAWFITIDSESRSPEIRGIITLKQK